MSAPDYDECLSRLLVHEGGYTNDAADPGGPTNFGITIADYRHYKKPNATAADVKAMRLDDAKAIYRAKYWTALNCDALPPGVDDSIFDYGVNSGIARAGKVLRQLVGLSTADWHVTQDVLGAIAHRDPRALVNAINDERLAFLKSLKTWPAFGTGWSRRVSEVRAFSLSLVNSPITVAQPRPAATYQDRKAKGVHPASTMAKNVAKGGGAVAAAGSGGLFHWIGAHPTVTFIIVAACAIGIIAVLNAINKAHETKQTTPMPVTPVPATT